METLKENIMAHLAGRDFSLIPEEELERVWPDAGLRVAEIEQFADKHGYQLFSYTKGRGAIFTRRDATQPN